MQTPRRSDAPSSSENGALIRRRCLALGYPPTTAEVVASEVSGFVADRRLDIVGYSDLMRDEYYAINEDGTPYDDDRTSRAHIGSIDRAVVGMLG